MSKPRRPAGAPVRRRSAGDPVPRRSAGDPVPRRSTGDPVQQALEALVRAVDQRLEQHPQGHLAGRRRGHLDLTLSIPVQPLDGVSAEAVERTRNHLKREVEALLAHRAAFRPGRVFCPRCASADCEHSLPASAREIFAGYGPTGLPRFQDYGQWLLEHQHPEIERLYQRPPQLVTARISGRELYAQLLPAFRERRIDTRIHGQVVAGWFPVPGLSGAPESLALSFQVISSATRRRRRKGRPRRRYSLNVIGVGPEGEPLAELYERLGSIRWRGAVSWSQEALVSIERSQVKASRRELDDRLKGVLAGIARRLEHHRRARDRRTDHAQQRHTEGDRPTRMALKDLAHASDEDILFDARRETLVVLGDKGRVHVFNQQGKLVTSIRYPAESIEKKRRSVWRSASNEEIARLRRRV
ncbi:MAG: hypothetical protein AAF560_14190 [Acidobacteriota bacterium]